MHFVFVRKTLCQDQVKIYISGPLAVRHLFLTCFISHANCVHLNEA
jgi:hypothetical protein